MRESEGNGRGAQRNGQSGVVTGSEGIPRIYMYSVYNGCITILNESCGLLQIYFNIFRVVRMGVVTEK